MWSLLRSRTLQPGPTLTRSAVDLDPESCGAVWLVTSSGTGRRDGLFRDRLVVHVSQGKRDARLSATAEWVRSAVEDHARSTMALRITAGAGTHPVSGRPESGESRAWWDSDTPTHTPEVPPTNRRVRMTVILEPVIAAVYDLAYDYLCRLRLLHTILYKLGEL